MAHINIDPENNQFLMETNLPTPIWQGLCYWRGIIYHLVGGSEHEWMIFPFSWEESSSQLTFTPSFFRLAQPPTSNGNFSHSYGKWA